eukprot:354892-Chlamydomonas_euryale.AAC.2
MVRALCRASRGALFRALWGASKGALVRALCRASRGAWFRALWEASRGALIGVGREPIFSPHFGVR